MPTIAPPHCIMINPNCASSHESAQFPFSQLHTKQGNNKIFHHPLSSSYPFIIHCIFHSALGPFYSPEFNDRRWNVFTFFFCFTLTIRMRYSVLTGELSYLSGKRPRPQDEWWNERFCLRPFELFLAVEELSIRLYSFIFYCGGLMCWFMDFSLTPYL